MCSLVFFMLYMLIYCCFENPDIIGVVQNVTPVSSIKRKIDNENISKRDITVADET